MKQPTQQSLLKPVVLVLAFVLVFGIGYSHFHGKAELPADVKSQPDFISDTDTTTHPNEEMQELITQWSNQQSFSSTVVVQELSGKLREATLHANDSVVPASAYKIYVAYGVLHGMEQGTYSLNTILKDGNTIQSDLNAMILNSDNDAARTLGFLVGWQNLNSLLKSQGINSTDLDNYIGTNTNPVGDKHTTSQDLATLLDKLYDGKLLTAPNTQLLLNLMKNQHYRERIPSGVPAGVSVADKPGWLTGNDDPGTTVQNDAAIVYGPKTTYILVITTNGSSTQPLADLSRQIYSYLQD